MLTVTLRYYVSRRACWLQPKKKTQTDSLKATPFLCFFIKLQTQLSMQRFNTSTHFALSCSLYSPHHLCSFPEIEIVCSSEQKHSTKRSKENFKHCLLSDLCNIAVPASVAVKLSLSESWKLLSDASLPGYDLRKVWACADFHIMHHPKSPWS